jgi:hypothetical protein
VTNADLFEMLDREDVEKLVENARERHSRPA